MSSSSPQKIDLEQINRTPLKKFVRPDKPSGCTWHAGSQNDEELQKTNPHTTRPFKTEKDKIIPNILHAIGSTPIVKLNRIPQSEGIECDMFAKCEFLNPGGSVKDRIGFRMVLDAEERGLLRPGFTIIEPTSGNTGIGLAMASAVRGYRCIIVMPLKMSDEKVATLTAFGAEIVRTPTEAAFDDEAGLIAVAQKIHEQIPNSIILDQYRNAGNPLAHYDGTGAEMIWAMENNIDMVVLGAGTGGTISGVARRIKDYLPSCKVVAVDPAGSILAEPEELNKTDTTFYEVEGIGYDFIPTVLDRSVVDEWVKIHDQDALPMAKRLIKEEGLLCGGSSGAAMYCALQAARSLKKGQRCLVLLPDNIRNYLTKFVQDTWMEIRNFQEPVNVAGFSWWNGTLGTHDQLIRRNILPFTATVKETIDYLKEHDLFCTLISDNGKNIGFVTQMSVLQAVVDGRVKLDEKLQKIAFFHQLTKVKSDATLGQIARGLEKVPFLAYVSKNAAGEDILDGFVLQRDILAYISSNSGGVDAINSISNGFEKTKI